MVNPIENKQSERKICDEAAATSTSSNIKQSFKINVRNGKGFFETGLSNTFWSRLIITAKIFKPKNGAWSIIVRDKAKRNLIVYENHYLLHDKDITFNYVTGLKTNLVIEATWTEANDTILCGEIYIAH